MTLPLPQETGSGDMYTTSTVYQALDGAGVFATARIIVF